MAVYGVFLLLHIAYIFKPREDYIFPSKFTLDPLVSIIIPTYNPDLYAIETILLNLQEISYENIEVFITDNSDSKNIVTPLRKICAEFNVNFFHREGTKGFKARNLNNVLPKITGKYFFIIDIDQSIKPKAIEKMIFIVY